MELIPAIDIRGGRCVRLLKGDFEQETRYQIDPVSLARRYAQLGAQWLHVVDLDGAAGGELVNVDLVQDISDVDGLRVQLGGGVRSRESLIQALEVAERAVVGSLAVTQPQQVAEWLREFGPERLTLALDVRLDADGIPLLATHGWQESSDLTLNQALERYRPAGLNHVLCTDIDRDGALRGPNLALYRSCLRQWPKISFQASGGVRDVRDLSALQSAGITHAIAGKALLEGRLSDKEIRSFLPNA